MLRNLQSLFSGQNLRQKTLRSSGFAFLAIGGDNGLRLISNLILTRLLFPEAFGLMALVQVFISGLAMFSDAGIRTAIIRHERGDDPVFLNTAWTIQIIRGFILWLGACALAYPVSVLYGSPLLAYILPIAGLNALIGGFAPTKVIQANRHLVLGRLTVVDLSAQLAGLIVMVILAYLLQSVWALVIGGLIGTILRLNFQYLFVPGPRNRIQWDRESVGQLFNFGKFIFLSTAVTFVLQQGDKAVLGGFVTLAELGIYNIAFMLAALPFTICKALNGKVIQPLYRIKPLHESAKNQANIFKARRLVIGGSMVLCIALAFSGIPLVNFLYDDRFALAGPILVLSCVAFVPRLVFLGYNGVLLAVGDSRRFFLLNLLTGSVQLAAMLVGIMWLGMFGVIIAPIVSNLFTHPLRVRWIAPLKGWDPLADFGFLVIGFGATAFACWLSWDQIIPLMG